MSFRSYNKTAPVWGDLGVQKNVSDFHIHNLDFMYEVIGSPEEVYSNSIDIGEQSIVRSVFKYKDKVALAESHTNLPEGSPFLVGFELVCENGTIKLEAAYAEETKERLVLYRNDGSETLLNPEVKDDYEEVIKHVRHCLDNGVKSDLLDVTQAMASLKMKDRILESLALGECVKA
ncbi:hypothetical protein NSQ26_11900 [Bacillus sp. FSL W7-1360]